jgi:Phage protein Gp138 N-terminal domain
VSLNPTLSQIIEAAIETSKQEHWSALSGTVHAVLGQGVVDVIANSENPIPDELGNTQYESLPIIPNVRVLYPRSGSAAFTFPVKVGDSGLVVMLTLSDAEWRNGQPGQPGDTRRDHLAFAVFIPGLFPDASPPQYADDPDVVIDSGASDIRLGGAATSFATADTNLQTELNKIAVSIGQIAALLNTAGPVVGAPGTVTPYIVASTACTKVKVL